MISSSLNELSHKGCARDGNRCWLESKQFQGFVHTFTITNSFFPWKFLSSSFSFHILSHFPFWKNVCAFAFFLDFLPAYFCSFCFLDLFLILVTFFHWSTGKVTVVFVTSWIIFSFLSFFPSFLSLVKGINSSLETIHFPDRAKTKKSVRENNLSVNCQVTVHSHQFFSYIFLSLCCLPFFPFQSTLFNLPILIFSKFFNRCSIDPYIFANFETEDGGKSVSAKFRAFKFPDTNYVLFVGTVNVCIKSCLPVNCGEGIFGYGKRRRRRGVDPRTSQLDGPTTLPQDPSKVFEAELSTFINVGYDSDLKSLPLQSKRDKLYQPVVTDTKVTYEIPSSHSSSSRNSKQYKNKQGKNNSTSLTTDPFIVSSIILFSFIVTVFVTESNLIRKYWIDFIIILILFMI